MVSESICHDHDQDESHYHHLPDCLLLEILCRLPVKSIFRFKCVSKCWLYLISDPSLFRCNISQVGDDSLPWTLYFRFAHDGWLLESIPKKYLGVHYVNCKSPAFKSSGFPLPFTSSFIQPPPLPPLDYCEILASSNDFLLFYGRTKYPEWQAPYYVSNPFTKQWIALPRSPRSYQRFVGFITQVKNGVTHYKVVLIAYASGPHPSLVDVFHFDIFSSETGEWRNSEVSLPKPLNLEIPLVRAIPYNGILHWMEYSLGIIIAYDPNNSDNRCRFVEMPMDRVNTRLWGLNGVLNVCQGRLCYFEMANIRPRLGKLGPWKLWVLKDYDKGEWCLENSVTSRKICSFDAHPDFHAGDRALRPIAFHPFDLDIMYFWSHGYILPYNLRTGWLEPEFYRIPATACICWWVVFQIVLPPWPIPAPQPCWNTDFEGMVTERKEKKRRLKKIFGLLLRLLGKGK